MSEAGAGGQRTRRGGLEVLRLAHPAGSTADVALHGAHVISFVPARGAEALFLSEASAWEPGIAIRGGIPVIFPQFAALGPLPRHGFARTAHWALADDTKYPASATQVVLRLRDSAASRAVWPHAFVAELTVTLEARSLDVALGVSNRDDVPLTFTAALHSYLRVGDVRRATLEGLRGTGYRSAVEGVDDRTDEAPLLTVTGEVDRTYVGAPRTLLLRDAAEARLVRLVSSGFGDTVVWNPWSAKARALPDMRDDEYLRMLCVEAAQVGAPVSLGAGERWRGSQRIEA